MRFRFDVDVGGVHRDVDLVQLPAERDGFAVLSAGEIDALVFRLRAGRLAEDLAIAIGAWTPPATIPANITPKDTAKDPHAPMQFVADEVAFRVLSTAWTKDILPLARTAAILARARAGFPDRWNGPAFEKGSTWARDGVTILGAGPCEGADRSGRAFVVADGGATTVEACFADDLDLPIDLRVVGGRAVHRVRLTAGWSFRPADRAVVAGSWMEPASVSPEAGVVFRSDGTSARFQSLRRSAASEQAAPASYCADPARAGADARHWVWDGARALELQGEPGVPGPAVLPPRAPRWRAVSAVPYRLVTGADEELQAGLWSLASADRSHRVFRRIEAHFRGTCDQDPGVHDRLAAVPRLPATLDLNARDERQRTPLTWAAARGRLDLVRALMRRGARHEDEAIVAAAGAGHLAILKALLPAPPISAGVLRAMHDGLVAAATNGHLDVARLLLERGASPSPMNVWSFAGPLVAAAGAGDEAMIDLLLARGARRGIPDRPETVPAVTRAIARGHLRLGGRIALEFGLDAAHAADRCDADLVRGMLDASSDRPGGTTAAARVARPGGSTALDLALACGDEDVARALLEGGADANRPGTDGRLPLARAVELGSLDFAALLLAHGARAGADDGAALTAAAVAADRRDLYELLVRGGAASVPGRPVEAPRAPPVPPLPPATSPFDEDDPIHPRTGYTPARERDPGCVDRTFFGLRVGPAVQLAIGRDGRARQPSGALRAELGLDPDIAEHVKVAQEACAFEAGTDASGRPVSLWAVLPRTPIAEELRRSRSR